MKTASVTAAAILAAGPALAHTAPGAHGSAFAGLAHPFLGMDHLLAMIAVGLLAAAQAQPARWRMPAAFVGAMAAGIALGGVGLALPLVEPMILASLLALAGLVAWAARLPLAAGMALMAVFGLVHGTAHGQEIGSAQALPYALGVLGSTALLHAVGLGLGTLVMRLGQAGPILRLLGAGLGLGTLGIALG